MGGCSYIADKVHIQGMTLLADKVHKQEPQHKFMAVGIVAIYTLWFLFMNFVSQFLLREHC